MNDLTSDKFKNSFKEALNLFNSQNWYEAHDALEDIWNELDGDERQIIQGILQISVSQFHLSKGNKNGAIILLGEGLGRIKKRSHINLGIDLVSFCICLEKLLNKLHLNKTLSENDIPFLKIVS
tara:strand:- start:670 stop:1041 length:372 start_codon:yes stop_codon:yes gene_type:complete